MRFRRAAFSRYTCCNPVDTFYNLTTWAVNDRMQLNSSHVGWAIVVTWLVKALVLGWRRGLRLHWMVLYGGLVSLTGCGGFDTAPEIPSAAVPSRPSPPPVLRSLDALGLVAYAAS